MKPLLVVAAFTLCSAAVCEAAEPTCETKAADMKLAGAAKNSFLKKCNADVAKQTQAACEANASDKKLAGAAKNSFVKKCVKDSAPSS